MKEDETRNSETWNAFGYTRGSRTTCNRNYSKLRSGVRLKKKHAKLSQKVQYTNNMIKVDIEYILLPKRLYDIA